MLSNLVLLAFATLQVCADVDPGHPANPIYRELIADGVSVNGTTVKLPAPSLLDGQNAQAALIKIAGDDRAAKELLRDSVTAPVILKTHDTRAGDTIIRQADLWFVVHAKLNEINLDQSLRRGDNQDVEAGNMKFGGKFLTDQDLRESKVEKLPPMDGRTEWFTHLTGRLLDRIQVEATDRAIATRTADSMVIAARTERPFDPDTRFPNRWSTLTQAGKGEASGPAKNYQGGWSYVKITRIPETDALLVEAHFAFVEPLDWFQGNPILRSKLGIIAQDQVRRLRREIEKMKVGK